MALDIRVFPCLQDNYAFLVRDERSGQVATIDTPDAEVIAGSVESLGWGRLDYIFNTHWHPDHTNGNQALKDRFGCTIIGPQEVTRIAPLDQLINPGDEVYLGETRFEIMDLSGHTAGQIGYINRDLKVAFVGDCLFVLGCGRLREGTPADMWMSLTRLMTLPEDTLIYSAHEYALDNLRFAQSVGSHEALKPRAEQLHDLRARGLPTVPSRLSDERATNPFLKFPLMQSGFEAQARAFGDLRLQKDQFR
ncbi:hydroxyacylglutathione hydrolase [Asticcacaulis machinosus]|uniref:Hydroxyacylglutathione hydrolase n=1 Tax=Asticcacaulis machinosus TaxID=2984211 RepID=A0ABT5HN41_9CAUL|nr:hydroxyacylglutathione hydrolase [Asticcacaulis machinosus]MDC7677658.1 hydroxyacylglutathione hydrolase [Asticcacaulis machinosus]